MIPGMNLNPKKIKEMMSKMGIKQEDIEAERVVIEKEDGSIIIENPSVAKVNMQGQETWQITGEAREEEKEGINDEDINTVVEKTGKTIEEARKALEETGDLAEAILQLQ